LKSSKVIDVEEDFDEEDSFGGKLGCRLLDCLLTTVRS
jgi:hypothetical protein